MLTLRGGAKISAETEVKRSRFLAVAARTDLETEARALIDSQKQQYPDARHHCSAYVIAVPGRNPIFHSSDDGEPAGTAGRPMLEVLRHSGLSNVTVVVTRYFGGTLLGTGGLARAYSQAVQTVLGGAPLVEVRSTPVFSANIDLAVAGRVEAELRGSGWNVAKTMWGKSLELHVATTEDQLLGLNSQLASLTSSPGTFHQVGIETVEVDVPPAAP